MTYVKAMARPMLVVAAALAAPSHPGLHAEDGITKDQADQVLVELKEIKGLLQQLVRQGGASKPSTTPERISLKLGEHYALGAKDALVTIVEFTDYQCPYCQRFKAQTFPELKKTWIDTRKVRFVTRDLPLPMHAHAMGAALSARCAGSQGKFWEMRDVLFANALKLGPPALAEYADKVGLNANDFQSCMVAERFKAEIGKDMADARASRITGTPTFVIGKTTKDGVEGLKFSGAMALTVFDAQIKALLPPVP